MKTGNIGVYTLEDNGALYRVRFANDNELIKIERLSDGWTKWINKIEFWVLLEELA